MSADHRTVAQLKEHYGIEKELASRLRHQHVTQATTNNANRSGRALILDAELESALAIVRSLGRKGLTVHVGSSFPSPIAAFSRYCKRFRPYPDPIDDRGGFQAAILEWINEGSYTFLIPVSDVTICPLMAIRDRLESRCIVAMASNHSLATAHSKSSTYALAGRCGLPVPRSVPVASVEELESARAKLSFPLVIKPDRSRVWPAGGAGMHLATTYAFDGQTAEAEARRLLDYGPVVLQEHIRGDSVGMGVLASGGRLLAAFQFRSLHEVPLSGGISSYRVSESVDPEIVRYSSKIIEALSWTGVAHVEFIRRQDDGAYAFMEVNGRFWASLPLATASGMDFPGILYELLVLRRTLFPDNYRVGTRCRLLDREVDWAKEVLRRILKGEASDLIHLPDLRGAIGDLLGLLNPLERTDVMNLRDPLPGLVDWGRFFRKAARDATHILSRGRIL